MSEDELSMSFASSIGIEDIREEYLNRSNLYTDLDQLEKSVEAEFEQYMIQARSFPFNEKAENRDEREITPQTEITEESQYEALEGDSADEVLEHIDTNVGSWQHYLESSVDERYNVKPMRNSSLSGISQMLENERELDEQNCKSRSTSPGEYFGARSLPLSSIDKVWEQPPIHLQQHRSVTEDQYPCSSYISQDRKKSAIDELIDIKFKSLPKTLGLFPKYELPEIELHHPYTQKRTHSNGSFISSTHQQCASTDQIGSPNSTTRSHNTRSLYYKSNDCVIEPSSPLRFLCELSSKMIYAKVIHLKITNPASDSIRTFNIFSSKNILDFEFIEGMIPAQETVEIKIKVRSSALIPYQRQQLDGHSPLSDKVIVLIDHNQVNELDVHIDFMTLDDDDDDEVSQNDPLPSHLTGRPKCRFCALEKGYPLNSL